MPEIQIRPAISSDISALVALDHHYNSDHVWQMEFSHDRETSQVEIHFRQMRLPRSVRVEYPYSPEALMEDWTQRSGLLVALFEEQPVGYISLVLGLAPLTTWVSDLIIDRPFRRKGIGSALILAAQDWATHMECERLLLEVQPRNHPAIQMALKLGFEFCGYNDFHFPDRETGLFFGKSV